MTCFLINLYMYMRTKVFGLPYYGGFAVPGHPHFGPFNSYGPTTNAVDAAARRHDEAYDELGPSAYWKFNAADEQFLKDMKKNRDDPLSYVGTGVFEAKRALNDLASLDDKAAKWADNKLKGSRYDLKFPVKVGKYKRLSDLKPFQYDLYRRKGLRRGISKSFKGDHRGAAKEFARYATYKTSWF
jgi:hypothetical protein